MFKCGAYLKISSGGLSTVAVRADLVEFAAGGEEFLVQSRDLLPLRFVASEGVFELALQAGGQLLCGGRARIAG